MKMSEARRQHPVAALTNSLKVVREHLVKIIILYLVGGQQSQSTFFSFTGLGILLGVLLLWGVLSWMRFNYRVEEGSLKIEYGVFVHKKLDIPSRRIQVIDVSSGIVQRMFGLVSLKVQTAGQSSEETEISAVTREEAERIREELRVDKDEEEQEEGSPAARGPTHQLSLNRLVVAGVTSGSIGVALSIIATILSQVTDILVETQLYEYLADYFESVTGLLVTLTLLFLLAGMLLAFLGTLVRFADFSVKRQNDQLVISRGLFERKQMTIPLNRIQSIRLVEGVLRQPFGLLSLQVDSAGYADEEGKSTELFPLMKRSEVQPFIRDMLPEFDLEAPGISPPLRASRRFIVKLVVPAVIGVAGILYYDIMGYEVLGVLPVVTGWGWLRYKDTALGRTEDMIFMRYRRLSRTTVLIPRKRIQRVTFTQNPFQKRGQVSDVIVTVASGRTGASFRVQHMDVGIDEWIHPWLFDRNENDEKSILHQKASEVRRLPGFFAVDL